MGTCPHVLLFNLVEDLRVFLRYEDYCKALRREPIRAPIGCTERQFAAYAQCNSLLKKCIDITNPNVNKNAIDLFLSVNSAVLDRQPQAECLADEYLLGQFRQEIYKFVEHEVLDHLDALSLYKGARCGPGASVGALGTDFYTKMFSGPLTCTSGGLYDLYRSALRYDPRGEESELLRTSHYPAYTVVQGSKLSCVPKNDKIARTICSEPVLNMFFQLGLGAVIEKGLYRYFGIDLSSQQSRNAELARVGSLSGQFATIDLSSASDLISPAVLKWAVQPSFYGWLDLLRSKRCKIGEDYVEMKMVSTMGNGYTFPLQTLIFTCALSSAYALSGIKLERVNNVPQNYGVNGDDIVCETKVFDKLCRLLHLLGLRVNAEKSFSTGDFRESCGADFYKGVNVRGVYVKSLRRLQDRFAVVNRLLEWITDHSIQLPKTIGYLKTSLVITPVPVWESYDSGIRVPYSFFIQSRWYRVNKNGSPIYQCWRSKPPALSISEDGRIHVLKGKPRITNSSGLLVAFLHGSLRHMKIGLRPNSDQTKIYVKRRLVAPDWDYHGGGRFQSPTWRQRWEASVVGYFFDVK